MRYPPYQGYLWVEHVFYHLFYSINHEELWKKYEQLPHFLIYFPSDQTGPVCQASFC